MARAMADGQYLHICSKSRQQDAVLHSTQQEHTSSPIEEEPSSAHQLIPCLSLNQLTKDAMAIMLARERAPIKSSSSRSTSRVREDFLRAHTAARACCGCLERRALSCWPTRPRRAAQASRGREPCQPTAAAAFACGSRAGTCRSRPSGCAKNRTGRALPLRGGPVRLTRAALVGGAGHLAQLRGGGACLCDEARELGGGIGEEYVRLIVLAQCAALEQHDGRGVHDGVQPVGDGEHGAVGKHAADGGLQHGVGLVVDGGGGLVECEQHGAAESGAGQAEQLPLADGEVRPTLGHLVLECARERCDGVGQPDH
eukprot:scaffold7738_cov107-Isochrysis_galbana.AAC.12